MRRQLEFNARLEAEREMFAKQIMAMQEQMQQQQKQQFDLIMKVAKYKNLVDISCKARRRWVWAAQQLHQKMNS
jgi:hypothetical protein